MEGLNAVTHFWVPLKLHPPPGTAEPPHWAETLGGHGENPQPLLHAAAGPSRAAGIAVGIAAGIAAGIVVGIAAGIAAGITAGITVGIVVGIAAGIAAGSMSQTCKTSPARATRNRFRSAKLY